MSLDTPMSDDTDGEIVYLPPGKDADDLEFGVRYGAYVNNIEPYGVFVTVSDSPRLSANDLSGLVHNNNIPSLYTSDDFAVDDQVVVMLIECRDNGDLNFEMVATDATLRGYDDIEVDPRVAPTGAEARRLNAGSDAEPARAAAEAASADDGEADDAAGDEAEVAEDDEADSKGRVIDRIADRVVARLRDEGWDPEATAYDDNFDDALREVIASVEPAGAGDLDAMAGRLDEVEAALSDLGEIIEDAWQADPPEGPREWPGRYGLAVEMLAQAAAAGDRVAHFDYDDSGAERTLTITTRPTDSEETP